MTEPSPPCLSAMGTSLEKTRFFPRQLITPDDLTQDQVYFREKLRRHNRLVHGWGIVCGCEVVPEKDEKQEEKAWGVTITPGYALGPYGDEIVLERPVNFDLRIENLDGYTVGPCGEQLDPWCSEVKVSRTPGVPYYVAVCYTESMTRAVQVQGPTCGCVASDCAYSRVRDGFAVKVLTSLPDSYNDVPGFPAACPPCPTAPWVVLARVSINEAGKVTVEKLAKKELGMPPAKL